MLRQQRTALAIFGDRVSPRFDCANDFVLITVANGKITRRQLQKIDDGMPIMKVKRLKDLQVDTLICGGVDVDSNRCLLEHGIAVVANIRGDAEEAVAGFLNGELLSGAVLDAGES